MGEDTLKNLEIENLVYLIRSNKVMLDADLATIYGVETKRLNEQVKRNIDRFPADFMFQLTKEEWESLKSQNATTKQGGEKLDAFLQFNDYEILQDAGKVSAKVAKKLAEEEYKKFAPIQDRKYVSDFDKEVKKLKNEQI